MWHSLIADTGGGHRNLIKKGLDYLRNVLFKPDKNPPIFNHNVAVQTERNTSRFINFLSGWSKRPIILEKNLESLASKMKSMYSMRYNRNYQKSTKRIRIGNLSKLIISYGFVGVTMKQSIRNDILNIDLKEDNTCYNSLNNIENDDFDILGLGEENDLYISTNISSDIEVLNFSETIEDVKLNDLELAKTLIIKMGNEEKHELLQHLLQNYNQNASETYDENRMVGENIQMCNLLMRNMKKLHSIVNKQQKVIKMVVERFERMIGGPTATEMEVLSYEMFLNEGVENL